jgi:hypothetical protein
MSARVWLVGGGRQRQPRHAREALVQRRQAQVFLAEVVSPLADAMRLVDGEQAQPAALVQRLQHRQEARRQDALGCGVDQRQPARQQFALDAAGLVAVERAVQEGGVNAQFVQRADLVVHQRNQRRHHHRDAPAELLAHDGRHLVAQALATAGGHQHQRVAAGDHVVDDGRLLAAEGRVAEHVLQHLAGRDGGLPDGVVQRGAHGGRGW